MKNRTQFYALTWAGRPIPPREARLLPFSHQPQPLFLPLLKQYVQQDVFLKRNQLFQRQSALFTPRTKNTCRRYLVYWAVVLIPATRAPHGSLLRSPDFALPLSLGHLSGGERLYFPDALCLCVFSSLLLGTPYHQSFSQLRISKSLILGDFLQPGFSDASGLGWTLLTCAFKGHCISLTVESITLHGNDLPALWGQGLFRLHYCKLCQVPSLVHYKN